MGITSEEQKEDWARVRRILPLGTNDPGVEDLLAQFREGRARAQARRRYLKPGNRARLAALANRAGEKARRAEKRRLLREANRL